MTRLVLASASAVRRTILANAGLDFDVVPAAIDERAAEAPLLAAGIGPDGIAAALAAAKAVSVGETRPGDLVLGADQVLELDGRRFTKPADMEAARRQLLDLAGRTHQHHSALAVARGGEIVWQHLDTAHLTMRPLTPKEIGTYLAAVGDAALASVGAYQIEGRGIQLFSGIEGSLFTIMGLPLLPLLAFLRTQGMVP